MSDSSRWTLRIANNSLFIDDNSSGRVILQQNARPGLRPYIHPLRIGDGGTLCVTEDSPWHHPWQHGIQTGFHGINGCDFWFDPGQHPTMEIGTIEPSTPRILSTDPPEWTVEALWRHTDGSLLMAEQQSWTLRAADTRSGDLFLDLAWRMQAIPDVEIEQHAYGGFFIRMPFRRAVGATVFNSTGQHGDETEQQPAQWVDLHMPLENDEAGAGITLLDHPTNPGHPVKWRVDGQRGINPAPCIPGPIRLAAGEALNYRYRMVLHQGALNVEEIKRQWAAYTS